MPEEGIEGVEEVNGYGVGFCISGMRNDPEFGAEAETETETEAE